MLTDSIVCGNHWKIGQRFAESSPASPSNGRGNVRASPEPLRLTWRDAVQMTLKQNPQVQVPNLKLAVTQENQIVARPALLPFANLAVRRENLETFLGMRIARVPRVPVNASWTGQGPSPGTAIPVYDFGVSLDVANLGIDLARADLAHATGQMESLYAKL